MLFTEPSFLFVFLPAVLVAYFIVPTRLKNLVLVLFSVLFYATGEWQFLPWLLASTAISYFITLGLAAIRRRRARGALLAFGIAVDLALLVVFKYAGFFAETLNRVLAIAGHHAIPVPSLALPLGISFFTFHKISYKVDVYRGAATVRRNPLDLLLYILLFPQLIAGPIVRYRDVAVALLRRTVTRADFALGARRFCIGIGKKMLIANGVAIAADQIFAVQPQDLPTSVAWLGIVCYAIQIYFDFSGYSDMAIGMARMFGFPFPENFKFPYVATSVTDFWHRWHMSLSAWFRDYLFISLGGNRGPATLVYLRLVTVFFLCGLWHGAKTTFVIWGLLHGAALVLERLFLLRLLERVPRPVRHAYTLLFLLLSWTVFRADNVSQAEGYVRAMLMGGAIPGAHTVSRYLSGRVGIALWAGLIGTLPWLPLVRTWYEQVQRRRNLMPITMALSTVGHLLLLAIFVLSASQIASSTYNPFIYFRF